MKMFDPVEMRLSIGHLGNARLHTYSQEEMLAYAQLRGFLLSAWTFRDWIKVGSVQLGFREVVR